MNRPNLLWSVHWLAVFHKQIGTLLYSLFVSWSFYWQSNGRVEGFTICILSDAYRTVIASTQMEAATSGKRIDKTRGGIRQLVLTTAYRFKK